MKLERFFEKFELFADAPNAVVKMREVILDLAVRGDLVEQNPDDTRPEMLEKKGVGTEAPDGAPVLPHHWLWMSLGSVTTRMDSGWSPACVPEQASDGVWGVLKTTAVQALEYQEQQNKTLPLALKPRPEHEVMDGDILFTRAGPMNRVGILCVARPTRRKLMISDKIIRFHLAPSIDPDFAALALTAGFPNRVIEGLKSGMAASQVNISQPKLRSVPIPVPPLAEQKRIVAKVDELMALCDRLEAQQQERDTRHAALARASLAQFAEAPTPDNLDFLFHQSYPITPADLRKAILSLAVQGKLVSQDPNDEPVEEFSRRIAETRRSLNAKTYGSVDADEQPYDIPESWAWTRLGSISLKSDSGWSPQCHYESRAGTDWGVLKVSAVSWGKFQADENKALPPGMLGRPDCEVRAGDFLLSRANTAELVARSVIVEQTPPRLMMSDKIVRFTFPDDVEKPFINMANLSDYARDYYARNASGTSSSMKNIGREVMCNLPLPLPPLAEQRRIVAKVDQLMALVDQMETQLATSRAAAEKLMNALVAELTVEEGKVMA